MKSNWTVPKLAMPEGKDWYVWFRYNGKLKPYKKGLNYIKDLKVREKEFNLLREALHDRLKSGWNPLLPDIDVPTVSMTVIEAFKFGLDKKSKVLKPRTYGSYVTGVNYVIKAIKALRLDYLTVEELKRPYAMKILEKTHEIAESWSNVTYNKNLGYIKSVYGILVKHGIIEHSPFYQIETLKEEETESNITADDNETKIIKEHLIKVFPGFYSYMVTIFHTGIRPDELLSIRLSDIDIKRRLIKLKAPDAKTAKYRNIPINNFLFSLLEEMELKDYSQEYYLFGSYREKERGAKPGMDFIPGPFRINRSIASKLWKKLVKQGLGIDVNLYSMKHLGANKKILAGMELDTLRELYGHTSKMMTLRYAKIVKQVYAQQIVELSPDF